MKIETLMWLLPVFFMIHELEEIIILKPWLRRNREELEYRFPVFKKILTHLDRLTVPAFALVVAEEFVILSVITIIAVEFEFFNLFAGLLGAFFLHMLMHTVQAVMVKRSGPAVPVITVVCLYCLYALIYLYRSGLLVFRDTMIWFLASSVFVVVNLSLAHYAAALYDRKMHSDGI